MASSSSHKRNSSSKVIARVPVTVIGTVTVPKTVITTVIVTATVLVLVMPWSLVAPCCNP